RIVAAGLRRHGRDLDVVRLQRGTVADADTRVAAVADEQRAADRQVGAIAGQIDRTGAVIAHGDGRVAGDGARRAIGQVELAGVAQSDRGVARDVERGAVAV